MSPKILLFILCVIQYCVSIPFLHAETYTPGANILLTGSTDDIRFDIAGVIFNSGTIAEGPVLETATRHFRGSFYLTGIGWGQFQTGTYQVSLDCGGTPLSNLTDPCRLTGSGWSENIGEIGFSGSEYIPETGMLSGTIYTFFGTKSVSGVFLPLLPARLKYQLDESLAFHDQSTSISGAELYAPSTLGWSLLIEPQKAIEPRIIIGDSFGNFSNLDFSLADTYKVTISDPNGGTTESMIDILPGPLSLTHTPGSYFIADFCNNHPASCPDGNTLNPTELIKTGDNLVGDGTAKYDFQLRSRDAYGNMITSGKVSILYTTTIKTIQIEEDGTTLPPSSLIGSIPGGGVILLGGVLVNNLDGTSGVTGIDMAGQDITYSIASIAPSNSENTVQLQSITYTTSTGLVIPITGVDTDPLVFRPWFDATLSAGIPSIQVGEDHEFSVTVTNNSSRIDVIPHIINFLTVGEGLFGAFRDFATSNIACQAYPQDLGSYIGDCDWGLLRGFLNPSVLDVTNLSSYTFTTSYAPMTRYPINESIGGETLVHYTGLDTFGLPTEVLYRTDEDDFGTSSYRDSHLKILGTNNAQGEYGDLALGGNGKAKFYDSLRKNIALLTRNRTDYEGTDYLVVEGNITLTGGSFDTKKSIIALGGDITLSDNIVGTDWPLAVIALTDAEGNGGVIHIDSDVTDLHASLITDRHILSSGDRQLYIRGSIISTNTLGDSAAEICPYYVTAPCTRAEASIYDLENMRSAFSELSDTTGKTALSERVRDYPNTALIIEHDARIMSAPPPGL